MRKLGILGLAALALALMTLDATAQMGGAVRGGVRGAAVGQMIGGDSAAKAGAVVGATRGAMDKETQMRAQYQTTPAYMNATHSNFNQVPPDVLVTPKAGATASKGGEAVINKGGKPAVGITFPPDWKQQSGETYVSAVSADGNAYSMLAIMESVTNLQAGIDQIKEGLKRYLNDIKYDDQTKTKGGALVITGTGKGTKSGVAVVFAAGMFESAPGQHAGLAFIVDDNVDEHYKDTVRYICATIRLANDFGK